MEINVQFADSTESVIITYFSGPQPIGAYANIGTVLPNDSRWLTFYNLMSVMTQSYLPSPTAD